MYKYYFDRKHFRLVATCNLGADLYGRVSERIIGYPKLLIDRLLYQVLCYNSFLECRKNACSKVHIALLRH